MTNTTFAALAALALVGTLGACSSTTTDTGNPHTVELTADRTAAQVGDSIEFNLQGTGQLLAGMALTYGDGTGDTLAAEGAISAGMRRKHAYSESGTYVVVGSVVDGTNLGLVELRDSVTVQISGGPGS